MEKFKTIMDSFFGEFEEYREIPKGKGIRGKLITIICPNREEAHRLAAIVESIHLASLLHDDVIDRADKRRGISSINAKYGDFTAIMLGDIIYSRAFMELLSFPTEIAYTISRAVYLLSQGELIDVRSSREFNPSLRNYYDLIYKKTASLIEGATKSGAILAELEWEPFALYGKNLGLAFQIIDDLLDVIGNPEKLGKPTMGDFREGKTTLPFIYLYQRLSEREREKLLSLYKKNLLPVEREWILDRMERYQIVGEVKREAKELVEEAKRIIRPFNIPELLELADRVVERER